MSTYYEVWKANEATGQLAIMLLFLAALALVLGWLIIPVVLPENLRVAARWGYLLVLLVLAGVAITWGV